jgi:hypothetical protein
MYKRVVILGLVAGIVTVSPLSWSQTISNVSKVSSPEMPLVEEAGKGQKQTGKLAGDKNFVLMVDETNGEFNFGFDENNEAESIQAKRGVIFTSDDMTLNSDEFEYNTKNSQVIATGKKVVVRMGEIIVTCQVFRYNPESQEGQFEGGPIVYNRTKDGKVQQLAGNKIVVHNVNGKINMNVTGRKNFAPYLRSEDGDVPAPTEQLKSTPGQKNATVTLDENATNRPSGNVSPIVTPRPSGQPAQRPEAAGTDATAAPAAGKKRKNILGMPDMSTGAAPKAAKAENNRIDPDNPGDVQSLSSKDKSPN